MRVSRPPAQTFITDGSKGQSDLVFCADCALWWRYGPSNDELASVDDGKFFPITALTAVGDSVGTWYVLVV